MSAQWRLAVSVGGFWLCSGRLDQKKSKKIRRVWAGFSVGDIRPGFRNFFPQFGSAYNESFAAVTYVTRGAPIRSLFFRPNTGTPRTGAANSCQVLQVGVGPAFAPRAPAGRCGHLRFLLAPPGCRMEQGERKGWSNSTSIDRGRSRATDGHSVNATRRGPQETGETGEKRAYAAQKYAGPVKNFSR